MDDGPKQHLLDVRSCARCGGDHDQVKLKRFKRPLMWGDTVIATDWGICPTTFDPIMVSVGGRAR